MAKVALVSHDVQTVQGRAGGVGTFVTHWARLLKSGGDEVTIILTHAEVESPGIDPQWAANYHAWGIGFIELHSDPPAADRWPEAWAMRLSEKLHPLLLQFDVVYFQDWANLAFHTARVNRFSAAPGPICITVLHGPSNWVRQGNRQYPRIPDDLHLEFVERYSAEHSDFVIAPSQYMLEWVRREGWNLRRPPVVLGLPFQPPAEDQATRQAEAKNRVIFFGRLETRKGFRLFTKALLELSREHPQVLASIEEIVLLGHEDEPRSVETIKRELAPTGLRVVHAGSLDSDGAGRYLREHADSVAVIASSYENFPYAVIETSLIPGLKMICSRGGGTPEVLGSSQDRRLFDPEPGSLSAKLREVLTAPGREPSDAPYDYKTANQAWLAFHRSVLRNARPAGSIEAPHPRPSVCVCIPYFNKARYFPDLLSCLEKQTLAGFGLVAVDDGSTQPEAIEVFAAMARKYASRGWKFLRRENAFVDAARNEAARHADSDYLFFIDADELLPTHAIARMLEAAVISGADCLVAASELFTGDQPPYTTTAKYMPLGANLVAGLIEPIIFGGPMILIRRKVFTAIGGYREVRGAAHEDWELQARLAMRGFDTDVLPEYLHQYRQLPDGLAKSSDGFIAKRRIIDCYEEQFAKIGMHGMGGAMFAIYRRCQELEGAVRESVPLELRMRLHNRLAKMLDQPK